jgi:hypothetical protein
MAVSGVCTGMNNYPSHVQNNFKQRQQDFQNLADALQAGNLQGAQQAFAALQKDRSSSPNVTSVTGTSQTGESSPLRQDIQTLQSALQANDLAGAQKALTNFQHDLQQAGQAHHYRHHHSGGGQGGVLQTLASFVSGLYRGSSDLTSSSSGTSNLSVTV